MYVSKYMYESSLCRSLRVRVYARRKSVLNVNGPGAVPFLTLLSARIVVSLSRRRFRLELEKCVRILLEFLLLAGRRAAATAATAQQQTLFFMRRRATTRQHHHCFSSSL
jgi:hypothetical protein